MAEKTEKATRQAPSLDWLEELEGKVHAASEALRELRGENRDLNAENEKLRKRLEKAEETTAKAEKALEDAEKALKATEEAGADAGEDAQRARVWQRERREIRDRVERITERLEELLEG